MKLLITGGYGNLGAWLLKFFAEKGEEVTVLSRSKKNFMNETNHQFIQADIESETSMLAALENQHFDVVLHCASFNDTFLPDYAFKSLKINGWGTRNLLNALKQHPPAHFIYLSTFHVYGNPIGTVTEQTPVSPRHDYATTHLFGELYTQQYAQTHNIPFSIIRLTNSYGCPLDAETNKWYLVLNDLAKMAFEKKEILLKTNGKAQRDFIWMGTVCHVLHQLAATKPENTLYNLSEEQTFSIKSIAEKVQKAYVEKYKIELPITINEADLNAYAQNMTVSSAKLKSKIPYAANDQLKNEALKIFEKLERH